MGHQIEKVAEIIDKEYLNLFTFKILDLYSLLFYWVDHIFARLIHISYNSWWGQDYRTLCM